MNRKNLITAVVGLAMVAALATVAIVFALDDEGGNGLEARVAELEERVEELEDRFGGPLPGFGRFGEGERPFGDLPLDELNQLFGDTPPEDLLRGLFERFGEEGFGRDFQLDPSLLEDLVGEGFLDDDQTAALEDALRALRKALEQRGD